MTQPSFERFGPAIPQSPVVVSVPHAGRDYPAALLAQLAVPLATARALEDRHIDAVAFAAIGIETLLVQRHPRAWIDLNRREDERDPAVEVSSPHGRAQVELGKDEASAKVRAGLGLIPRRAGGHGDLWRRRWTDDEVAARIIADHRPYHAAIDKALTAASARFGMAVLIDLHSMPPLAGTAPARIVIGDRHGTSANATISRLIEVVVAKGGLRWTRNLPYAGGHVIERHGCPSAGIHAVQIEIDRALYLDRSFDRTVQAGVAAIAQLLKAMIDALSQECRTAMPRQPLHEEQPLAAE